MTMPKMIPWDDATDARRAGPETRLHMYFHISGVSVFVMVDVLNKVLNVYTRPIAGLPC